MHSQAKSTAKEERNVSVHVIVSAVTYTGGTGVDVKKGKDKIYLKEGVVTQCIIHKKNPNQVTTLSVHAQQGYSSVGHFSPPLISTWVLCACRRFALSAFH